jgi:polyhydroxybutyrate depolymerase
MFPDGRRLVTVLLIIVGLAALPGAEAGKACRRVCKPAIVACRDGCNEFTGRERRRCRKRCKRMILDTCRADPEARCVVPPSTSTTTTTSTTLPGGTPTGFQSAVHVTSSGVDRTYSLFVPESYDAGHAYPVVFGFHGDGGTGAEVRDALALEEQAGGEAIFVYPDATEESFRSFDLESPLATNADMRLFLDILDALDALYHVDRARVFATGVSRGGFFVNFLNCRLGALNLRAIAPVAGSGPYGPDDQYDIDGHFMCEATAVAALLIHGVDDNVVPLADADYSRFQWTWANQCAATTTPYEPAPCVSYDGCAAGRPVVWCAVPGVGHAVWSEAPRAIWAFFASLP